MDFQGVDVETGEITDDLPVKRRMPAALRKKLLTLQGGKKYLPAAYRIVWFRDVFPQWGIEVEMIEGGLEKGLATMRATIRDESGRIIAQDFKTETKQDFPAGWVEKAATGAISRALSNCGFGTQFDETILDEDGEMRRPSDSGVGGQAAYGGGGPAVSPTDRWEGPGQCPRCHAPEGKRHGKPCTR